MSSYPVAADFRDATLAEYCRGLSLTTADSDDAHLTATIARMVKRLELLTNDIFVSTSATYDLRGFGTSSLELPQRCTAVATVKTRDYIGNLTTQSATAYRLVSSLDAAGANLLGYDASGLDYLEVVPFQYLVGIIGQAWWTWPRGPKTVQVVGTFGWTVTPADISRAVALLVFDQVKPLSSGIRRAQTVQTSDAIYNYDTSSDSEKPTGITEADEIIRNYRRSSGLLVG